MDEKKDEIKNEKKPEKGIKGFIGKLKTIKNIEIYLALIVGSIIVIIFLSSTNIFGGGNAENKNSEIAYSAYDYCTETEKKLADTLKNIRGVGSVKVMINFEGTPELIIAYVSNETSNKTGESTVKYSEAIQKIVTPQILNSSGSQIPIILKQINPKVLGVIVACEGADNVRVKMEIINAVSVLFQINPNLVYVFSNK